LDVDDLQFLPMKGFTFHYLGGIGKEYFSSSTVFYNTFFIFSTAPLFLLLQIFWQHPEFPSQSCCFRGKKGRMEGG
jgi:hypothetical protein